MTGSKRTNPERIAVSQADAARLLGISDWTIREWEKRGLVAGKRVNNGKRLYPLARLKELAGVA